MRFAVIDMGTNTFNVLVAEKSESRVVGIFHAKIGVMLGNGGINQGVINAEAYWRAVDAVKSHVAKAKELNVEMVKAFATSAIRSASNGNELVSEISSSLGVEVEIISGEREAELIYKGVAASMDLGIQPVLIMDIGGGSNEFIIANRSEIFWKHSFPLGMSRILERFKPQNSMSIKECMDIEEYFDANMQELWSAVAKFQPTTLVGASGSFDTIRDLLFDVRDCNQPTCAITYERFVELHNRLQKTTLEERLAMKGMDSLRAEMMVLASILINLVLNKTGIRNIIQSDYSLKEGAISEMFAQK